MSPRASIVSPIYTVVPDTNVWAYLAAASALEELRMTAKRRGVRIVACPAVVYEGLRQRDPEERARRAAAISLRAWLRPMPEAYVESMELRREVARLRPDWLIPHPDPALVQKYRRNEHDWRGAFWQRVRKRPDQMARWIGGEDRLEAAREVAKARRREALESTRRFETLDLQSPTVRIARPGGDWGSAPVERWRVVAAQCWEQDLILAPLETFHDWLLPWLDLRRMWSDRDALVRFWREGVDAERMPRAWIRWAMEEVQVLRKITPGTPGDNQISTYLPDFDLFVSSDRGFVECIRSVRKCAPVALADAALIPGGDEAAHALLELIEQHGD